MIEIFLLTIVALLGFAVGKLTAISNHLAAIRNQLALMIKLDTGDRRQRRYEEDRKWRDKWEAVIAEETPPRAYSGYTGPDWAKGPVKK